MLDSILTILKLSYAITYPPDGYDPINNKQNGKFEPSKEYMFHYLTIISSFLGLPNRDLKEEGQQSIGNLVKNLIGWEDHASLWRRIFNVFKAPFFICWYLPTAMIRLATNVVKLVTEFLPMIIANSMKFAAYVVGERMNTTHNVLGRAALGLLYLPLKLTHYLFDMAYIIGRIITSPHKSVRMGWRQGLELAGKNWKGWLLGGVLATISIAMTAAIYAVALPIAAKYIVACFAPHIPAVTITMVNVAVSAVIGATITILGTISGKLIDDLKNAWFNCTKKMRRAPDSKSTSIYPERTRVPNRIVQHKSQNKLSINEATPLSYNSGRFFPAPKEAAPNKAPPEQSASPTYLIASKLRK